MVEELIPLNSSNWVRGQQSSEQSFALFRSWWVVWNVEVISRSSLNLMLQIGDVEGIPRRLTENHLVEADTDGPEISLIGVADMGSTVEELRGHSNWGPELCSGHIGARLGKTEISNDDGIVIEEDVSQLKISMHNLVLVEFLESIHNLHQKVDRFLFTETLVLLNVVLKITVVAVINDQVVIVCGLKVFVKMENIWMLDFTHDSHFCIEKSSKFWVLVNFLLSDGLDSENFIGLLLGSLEHGTELTFTEL